MTRSSLSPPKSAPSGRVCLSMKKPSPPSSGYPRFTGKLATLPSSKAGRVPTCDINGLTSGYQGPGPKTIIPAKASAKVSMRLVPDQNPTAIRDAFTKAIKDRVQKCDGGNNLAQPYPSGPRSPSQSGDGTRR